MKKTILLATMLSIAFIAVPVSGKPEGFVNGTHYHELSRAPQEGRIVDGR